MSRSAAKSDGARGAIPAAAGIGLRFQHHRDVVQTRPEVAWLEVHTENYFGGGAPLRYLDAIRANYPISLHGIGLSLGGVDAPDASHLARVRRVVDRVEPGLVSEHLSWSSVDGAYLADLLPLPLTEEALDVVCRHVERVQACLRRSILIENPSTYLRFAHSTIPEWEFLSAVARRTGCAILCDVNNVYVSACNHGFDASAYLAALPADRIGEIHLAGHAARDVGDGCVLRIDDHGSRVAPDVWALYAEALARFGAVPTLIEWDSDIPSLDVLLDEAARAQRALDTIGNRAGGPSRTDERFEPARSLAVRKPGRVGSAPSLHAVQQALRRSVLQDDDRAAAEHVVAAGIAAPRRLAVYRNTFRSSVTHALRLAFPAIHRLVGDEFFGGAVAAFAHATPPRSACLDDYGSEFPQFLARFPPAAQLAYLPDVGRLEWAVNRALHAPDVDALEVARLVDVAAADHERVTFTAHPSVSLLECAYPVDAIWRAVLDRDDAALAAIDLAGGSVWLVVQRSTSGVDVTRVDERAWRFAADLCAGRPLAAALDDAADLDAPSLLAEHLRAGRFVAFDLAHEAAVRSNLAVAR